MIENLFFSFILEYWSNDFKLIYICFSHQCPLWHPPMEKLTFFFRLRIRKACPVRPKIFQMYNSDLVSQILRQCQPSWGGEGRCNLCKQELNNKRTETRPHGGQPPSHLPPTRPQRCLLPCLREVKDTEVSVDKNNQKETMMNKYYVWRGIFWLLVHHRVIDVDFSLDVMDADMEMDGWMDGDLQILRSHWPSSHHIIISQCSCKSQIYPAVFIGLCNSIWSEDN